MNETVEEKRKKPLVMGCALALFAALGAMDTANGDSFDVDGEAILSACLRPTPEQKSLCLGYVVGATEGLLEIYAGEYVCMPKNERVSGGRLKEIVTRHLREDPEVAHHSAAENILQALTNAFPCSTP